jgi:hypothetical protein
LANHDQRRHHRHRGRQRHLVNSLTPQKDSTMSTLVTRTIQTPDGQPRSVPNGIRIGSATGAGAINHIGTLASKALAWALPPACPAAWPSSTAPKTRPVDNYGNYQYSDGSVMVYVPAFYYKYGTGANALALNVCSVVRFNTYADVATANAAGYALHRAFYNGGSVRPGFFVDKYLVSKNGSIAQPQKRHCAHQRHPGRPDRLAVQRIGRRPMLFTAPLAWPARGVQRFPQNAVQNAALALLSWPTAVLPAAPPTAPGIQRWQHQLPKGNNNNALGDANDATIAYTWDGNATYAGCGKTGSANFFAKTTHNGQNCGVADLNGLVWEISPIGLTSNGSNYFLLNTSVDVATITSQQQPGHRRLGRHRAGGHVHIDIGTTYGAADSQQHQQNLWQRRPSAQRGHQRHRLGHGRGWRAPGGWGGWI